MSNKTNHIIPRELPWLVAHTRPQWEQIVCRQLEKWYGINYYCPLQKVKRKYTDRIKYIEKPLFKSYVFVQPANYKEQVKILQLDGVTSFVRHQNKAAIIHEVEMTELKTFISSHSKIEIISVGTTVVISKGAMMGMEGTVTAIKDKKVILELPQLGFRLVAALDEVMAAR